MNYGQLKAWMRADPRSCPQCYVMAHAGGAKYSVEVEVKHHLEPLRDDATGEVMQFDNVGQVGDRLKALGIEQGVLRLFDPYDEFATGDQPPCKEDMPIRF
ncbi:hypothetical protein BZJ19_07295 [Salinivibrio proteolyticus]|uniref:DUF6482 family protein n=2 Tax=Salinivibrio TaxID=51366 RepID=A0ABY7LD32_9GAMM|nr:MULTISPECIES: DUF6482 family protein [Salinivibrio]OOF10667.1 hypothetical protein BZG82_07050 [Salinivibrio sp. PR5]OOF14172.1 hypothetical protein BZG83_06705 [Salinivibrio sp. PR919]OOF18969.1 hypothetical protein BZG84_01865 [Salinivibrio sp. PR932]OOF20554.1 hypothetical protein BZJ17_12330 [Salinivibrio sp. IB574]OOF25829.1 hypothetical protein BZJ19_07295 [Salinivibrio proteolyticus]